MYLLMEKCFKFRAESSEATQEVDEKPLKDRKLRLKLKSESERNVCRICYEVDEDVQACPCKCLGSHAYAHINCLKLWIIEKFPKLEESHCEICKKQYKIKVSYSLKYQKPETEEKKVNTYCKLGVLLTFLFVLICVTIIVFILHVDLKHKIGYSISVICACLIPLCVNIGFIVKVFVSNYFIKVVKSWNIKGINS
jgi:E3 ubiquitin-protein ligase MARCH1/8